MRPGGKLVPRAARSAAVVAIMGAVIGLASLGALASHVDPVFVEGNPTCPEGTTGFKIDGADFGNGQKSDGTLTVTITNFNGADASFDWASNIAVDQLIVKGGSNANVYTYDPEATSDTGLHTPLNPANDQNYGLSHVEFCYDVESTPSPSPSPSQSQSQSPSPTPSQSVSPSPSPSPSVSVLPTETERPQSPSPSASVLGRKLGRTGADVMRWLLIGVLLVGLGVLTYVVASRNVGSER